MLLSGAAFAATLFALGCFGPHDDGAVAQRYTKADELQPMVLPYEEAYVIFAGNPVATDVSCQAEGSETVFTFKKGEAIVDLEKYSLDDVSLKYLGSEYDSYDPGLTILRFPFEVGDEWTWTGKYKNGPEPHEATAKVKTAQERLNTVVGEFATVRVTVELEIASGTPKPVEHKLVFWLAPKKGIVRREIKFSTTREPMPPVEEQ